MAANKTTSPRVAKIASKALSRDSSSKVTKTLAGTALAQAKPSKKISDERINPTDMALDIQPAPMSI